MLVPLAHELSLIVAVPKASIKDCCKSGIPFVFPLLSKLIVKNSLNSFLIALYHSIHIFRTTSTTFNLKHSYTTLHHTVDETNCLNVLWRHDVLIIYVKLIACLIISYSITTTTDLYAFSAISRTIGSMQTHIALATDSHTKSSVTEHLYTYLFT